MTWYTRNTWSKLDEEEFLSRLKRAREYNRPQYLNTQAIVLIQTNKLELLNVAESLLKKFLDEYPNDTLNKSSVLNSLGLIYRKRNDLTTAIKYFKESVEFENIPNSSKTDSYIEYSELIVKTNQINLFADVLELINLRGQTAIFPIQKYKLASILSVIYRTKNNIEMAQHYAQIADENANSETSGFRYHKDVGIVKNRTTWLDKIVKRK